MRRRLADTAVRVAPALALFVLAAAGIALGSEGGGGHGEGGTTKWLDLLWRTVNFIILAALLWKLLADKVKKYFIERREEIAQLIEEADRAKADAQAQFAEMKKKLANVERDIEEIKTAIMGELDSEKARIIEEGRLAAERIIQQAKWTADQEVVKARKELKEQVVDMAADLASGIVTKSMTPEDQKRILEEYLDRVAR
ncbi:MAG TPA: ATP synthase F0 subunit B [Deltaproteobacteria bacterium]|nr:ATP synthase F0 subunit B [Deltaproteobacteria bacterium]HOM28162.1 ATP synthase F0 subunit B [Deltaproteobacteria bacterium]HPP79302.1 ATP synthase F0 subunit B [Deltaproteobacteria bacterium]